jgi:hypothetical protein
MKENRDKHNKLKELNKKENLKEHSKGGGVLGGLPAKKETKDIDKLKREIDKVRDQVNLNTYNQRDLERNLMRRNFKPSRSSDNVFVNQNDGKPANRESPQTNQDRSTFESKKRQYR